MKPLDGEQSFSKVLPKQFSGHRTFELFKENEIKEVVITGLMLHMFVEVITRAAFDFGYKYTVLEDSCASRVLEINRETVVADGMI